MKASLGKLRMAEGFFEVWRRRGWRSLLAQNTVEGLTSTDKTHG